MKTEVMQMTLIYKLKQPRNPTQTLIILQFNQKLLIIQVGIINMMLIQKRASKTLKKSWNWRRIVNLQRLAKKRKRLRKVRVLCQMRVKDHLKPFTGTNILHSVMLLLLEVNFHIKLVLVKIRKILGQIKPKTLQQRAKIYLI